jgi:hypothetical protein
MPRPLAITVIAWVIIALSVEGLISLLGGIVTPIFSSGVLETPFSVSVTAWISGISLAINLGLGVLILSGFGWARIVYILILAYGLAGTLLGRHPVSLAVLIGIKLMVCGYFFFRREANEYFAKSASGAA